MKTKRQMMFDYIDGKTSLKSIDSDECLDIAYILLEASFPLINKAIRHESNDHMRKILQSSKDNIESAIEGII